MYPSPTHVNNKFLCVIVDITDISIFLGKTKPTLVFERFDLCEPKPAFEPTDRTSHVIYYT